MGIRIVIDAGHGGQDPGVIDEGTGLPEKTANLWVALTLKHLLVQDGHTVILTRADDTYLSLNDRADVRADLLVSIHHDWHEGRALLYYSATTPRSEMLGMTIAKALDVPLWSSRQSPHGSLWIEAFAGPAFVWEVARLQDVEPTARWRVEKCAAFLAGLRVAW